MTEDFLAVVESKRFLGREFLTWLVHAIEEGGGRVERDGEVLELILGDRVVLAGTGPDKPRLTVAGTGDLRAEIGAGLRRGKLLDQAKLAIVRGERRWELSLDGGMLTYDTLRCPPLGDRDQGTQDDPRAALENDLFLRIADMEDAVTVSTVSTPSSARCADRLGGAARCSRRCAPGSTACADRSYGCS